MGLEKGGIQIVTVKQMSKPVCLSNGWTSSKQVSKQDQKDNWPILWKWRNMCLI